MTRKEYLTAYRSVRKSSPTIIKSTMTQIRQAYITAAEKVADEIRVAQLSGMSDFTIKSWQNIDIQLNDSIGKISKAIEDGVPASAGNFSSRLTAIDEQYLLDANARAGAGLSAVKIKNMFVKVNDDVIANIAKRVYSDGYTFSERCWRVGTNVPNDMRQTILSGLAQGRDPVKIAKDLEVYVAEGKASLMKRYGNLEAGTKEFAKRIPKNVDYRAMRIVRSELYASLKETGLESGRANPSALDAYDWVMQSGRADWDCDCPDLARNSPYTYAQFPAQPHPNCGCYSVARLMDTNEFVADLKRWSKGESVQYIDDWKAKYYDFI